MHAMATRVFLSAKTQAEVSEAEVSEKSQESSSTEDRGTKKHSKTANSQNTEHVLVNTHPL